MVTDDELAVSRLSSLCEEVEKRQAILPAPIVGFGPHALSRKTTGRLLVEGAIAIEHDDRLHRRHVADELEKRHLPQTAAAVRERPSGLTTGAKKTDVWTWGDLLHLAETLNRDLDSPEPREKGAYAPYETVADLRVTNAPAEVVDAYTRLVAGRHRSTEIVTTNRHREEARITERRSHVQARKRTLRL